MTARTYRPLMMAAAALMALLGAGAFILSSSSSASARNRYTIEITDTGFNPSVCNINRDDEVVWKNVGTKVRRVIKPDVGIGGDPLFDTGDILPGETTRGALILNAGTAWTMYDKYDPSISGIVETPGRSNTGTVRCSPAPPTPTPSPTPSVSPTATASPSPTPSPTPSPMPTPAVPPRCVGMPGCAVGAALAADK